LYFLAIDLGTQSIKAAIVDDQGEILAVSQEQHEVDSPSTGWAQQNPESYRNIIIKVGGYSAYFTDLGKEIQDEIISRTEHTMV